MKNILLLPTLFFFCLSALSFGQIMPLTAEPDGGNKKASVTEQIGIVKVEINYSRPGVKGREGKIWGSSVAHYGFVDLGHGTSTAAPWRAGANENTTISFSQPVTIEGKELPAGKYGFFISLGETENTLIFSRINSSWGSFYYDPTQDALRVTVKHDVLDKSVEWLKYEFINQTDNSATIALSWEKRIIAFKVEAETEKLQMEAFRNDLRTTRPYYDFIQAANYCIQHNIELEQALAWMDRAIYFRIMGEKNFRTLSTKAAVLMKMNRTEEAKKVMGEALPLGSMLEVHFYGRTLLNQNQTAEAFKVFKLNYDKYPAEFTTNIGLARAYAALGDYKKALSYAKVSLPKAPDEANKMRVQAMIKNLEEGKNIN
jgi:hypothetical protein